MSKRVYQKDGKKVWTDADLEDGVEIELHPQERVLLVLTLAISDNPYLRFTRGAICVFLWLLLAVCAEIIV